MRIRSYVLFLALSTVAATQIHAQQRANAATQAAASVGRAQAATQTAQTTAVQTSETDRDLGEQQKLDFATGGIGAYFIGNTGLQYTSNPSLSRGGGQGDMYFFAQGGAGIYPNIAGGLFLDAHVYQSVFQYAHFSNLNFTAFNAGGGLDYVFSSLGGLTASVHYEYERYLDGDTLDEFYVDNSIVVGLSKEFTINENHAIQVGWESAFSLTAYPSESRRNEHDFWLGWRWRIISPLELQTYYLLALYDYTNDNRFDATSNFGATLNYYFTTWARLSASGGFAVNGSTDAEFDYTVANVGGSLSLDIRF